MKESVLLQGQELGWMQDARQWILDVLSRNSLQLSGDIDSQKLRPWSAVLKIPTSGGAYYFKASSDATAFEPRLTAALYRWTPDCVPSVLSIEPRRSWMIMADSGQPVRQFFQNGLPVEKWNEILRKYAAVQIAASEHLDELTSYGVRDRRPAVMPELFDLLIGDEDWLLIEEDGGLSKNDVEVLRLSGGYVESLCQRLADFNVPNSVHHNDLHDANIFYNSGKFVFFDWGDSSISHPFFSLRTSFVSVENTFDLAEGHPIFQELAASYLGMWSDFESQENLWEAYRTARRLWSLSSCIKYWTIFSQLDRHRDYFKTAVPSLLKEFLDANPELREDAVKRHFYMSSSRVP
ncbi:MAG: phosphotransferase [Candidatus Promineifilaceae bacterium]